MITFLSQIGLGRYECVVQNIVHMTIVGLENGFRLLDVDVLCENGTEQNHIILDFRQHILYNFRPSNIDTSSPPKNDAKL